MPPRGSHRRGCRRAAGLEHVAGLLDVVLAHQPGRDSLEDGQVELAVAVEVGQRKPDDRPVDLLADKDEIEDADDSSVDQVHQQRERLSGHAVARKLQHQVVDRAHLIEIVGHLVNTFRHMPSVVAVSCP